MATALSADGVTGDGDETGHSAVGQAQTESVGTESNLLKNTGGGET
jgi:hypothetical protein